MAERQSQGGRDSSLTHYTLSQTGRQERGGQNMFKLNKPGENSGCKMGIYRGDKSHLAQAVYADYPFLTGSLQCPEGIRHLPSERPGPQKIPPVRGFKYQVLGEQLGPAPPGPLPGRTGHVRVRECWPSVCKIHNSEEHGVPERGHFG